MSENNRIRTMTHSGVYEAGPFNGTMFYNAPLIYRNGGFELQKKWNEVCSYNSKTGLTEGSTYFQCKQVSAITIYSHGKAYVPPTSAQGSRLFNGRNGCTYNGSSGALYSLVQTDISYGGSSNIKGVLFFPDDANISGPSLTLNNTSTTSSITEAWLKKLINKKCLFLPFCGRYYGGKWFDINTSGIYPTKSYSGSNCYFIKLLFIWCWNR